MAYTDLEHRLLLYMGVKLGLSHSGKKIGWCGIYWGLRSRKKQENGENFI